MAVDPGMTVRVSRVHYPVRVLGPGDRLGIWFQGCSIGCRGCISRDTWDGASGTATAVERLIEICGDLTGGKLAPLTVSGGEPFDQPDALAGLLTGMRRRAAQTGAPFDVVCFSGRTLPVLRARYSHILRHVDLLIAGPYRAGAGHGGALAGSANQQVVPLTSRGAEMLDEVRARRAGSGIQIAVEPDGIWMIGIPRPGDMERVETELAARGVALGDVSWR